MAADTAASITVRNYESSDTYGNFGVHDASAVGRAGGTQFSPGMLAHVPAGSDNSEVPAPGPCGFMVVDGLPPGERLVMWWNFVARCAAGIASARESWMGDDDRLGPVHGYDGGSLPAPLWPRDPQAAVTARYGE